MSAFGDHLITSGYHDITPEQERVIELRAEFEKRCAADPQECPQFIWESLCDERGVDPIEARGEA